MLDDLLELTAEHLMLVAIAMAIAIAIGVPSGIFLTRHGAARRWMLATVCVPAAASAMCSRSWAKAMPVT